MPLTLQLKKKVCEGKGHSFIQQIIFAITLVCFIDARTLSTWFSTVSQVSQSACPKVKYINAACEISIIAH